MTVYAVRATKLSHNHPAASRGYIICAHCHYSSKPPPPLDEDSAIFYPVTELLSDESITWRNDFVDFG